MTLNDGFELFIQMMFYERNISNNTLDAYKEDLSSFFNYVKKYKCEELDLEDLEGYIRFLSSQGKASSTIIRKVGTIKQFYVFLQKQNILKNKSSLIELPKKDKYLPKFLKDEEANKIFEVCKYDTPINQRNSVIIELLYATGIRVSELVNIKISDIDINERTIKVLGKGSKERMVIFNNHTKKAIEIYLNDGYHEFNKLSSGYLILNKDGNKLSERYIRNIINKLVTKAGLDIKISPHTFRHTFATDMLEDGSDLMTVKELLGHESLNTTSIYTHVTNEQIRKVYEMAHPRAKK